MMFFSWFWFAIYPLFYSIHIFETHAHRNERNLMLVLPVMQGNSDPTDPRLQFWYTKPPVTFLLEDNPRETSTSETTKKHTMKIKPNNVSMQFNHTDETNKSSTGNVINGTSNTENKLLSKITPHFELDQYISNPTTLENLPSFETTTQPNLYVIAAQPKWKYELKKQNEYEKLKYKSKLSSEKSTILPSFTRFHYHDDFIPIPSIPESSVIPLILQEKFIEKSTTKSQYPTTTPDDPIKVYEMLKKSPLKPLPMYHEDIKPIFLNSKYTDVLENIAIPQNGVTKEEKSTETLISSISQNSTSETELPVFTTTGTTTISITENASAASDIKNFLSSTSDTLTDEFQQMLIELGIVHNNESTTTEEDNDWRNPENFTIDPLSYTNFKKIPEIEQVPSIKQDMQSLLSSFGLLPQSKDYNSNLTRITREIKEKHNESKSKKLIELKHRVQNSFSELKKIKENQTSYPQKVSPEIESVKMIPKPRIESTKQGNENGTSQQLGFSFSERSSTETIKYSPLTENTTKITTEKEFKRESNEAPFSELLDSASEEEKAIGDESDEGEVTHRPNGLYFFVDWNRFMNVDDGNKKPIKVKFAPKAGNPKLFIPITFP